MQLHDEGVAAGARHDAAKDAPLSQYARRLTARQSLRLDQDLQWHVHCVCVCVCVSVCVCVCDYRVFARTWALARVVLVCV